ncbi:hypothetical protein QQG74_27020 [Micromonospora sp. FIMYZ51]|uniref:hypothetical protein n=1 Tax=Micromonospora sp. FIMYZ51 TaxID=3051832 RepID=UPI00311D812D
MLSIVSVIARKESEFGCVELDVGRSASFGECGCGCCVFDIRIPRSRAAVSGQFWSFTDHWRLDNSSSFSVLLIRDAEGAGCVSVGPGNRAVVSFEVAHVSVAGEDESSILTVLGPEPVERPPAHRCPQAATDSTHPIRRGTIYFEVLVALCAPRLSGTSNLEPTSRQIAADLRQRGIFLNDRSVDAHIDYLVDRLDIRAPDATKRCGRPWKKQLLVNVALNHNIVTHLDLQNTGTPTGLSDPSAARLA